jgi:isoamyl acetate esterase
VIRKISKIRAIRSAKHNKMKNLYTFALAIVAILFMSAVKSPKPIKIIFFGDSITQAGIRPDGYIDKLKQMLDKNGIKDNYQLIGAGIGGNKVYDLYLRLEEDVLEQKPDVVVIWVGVNDVWHKRTFGTGTDPDKFEKFYVAIIKKLQSQGVKVIVATPSTIGERTDFSNEQDGDLNRYAQIMRDIAAKYDCPVADFRKEFLKYNLEKNKDNKESGILTSDRVHLNEAGNQLVADILYKLLIK